MAYGHLLRQTLIGAGLGIVLVSPGHAIVAQTTDDLLAGLGLSVLDGVAKLTLSTNTGTYGCSGSLLAGGAYVLTAAHCLTGTEGTATTSNINISFLGGTVTASSTSYVVNPGWDGSLGEGNDLAIIQLGTPITGIAGYALDTTGSQRRTVLLAGYGNTGSGATGSTSGTYGTLHYGYNQYDGSFAAYTDTYLFDFDDGTRLNNVFGSSGLAEGSGASREIIDVMIASGDSGGAGLVEVDGVWYLAGVHSFSGCLTQGCSVTSSFGSIAGDTSVFANLAWLLSVTSTGGASVVAVPEPASFAMLLAGLGVVGWRASAKRRPVSEA